MSTPSKPDRSAVSSLPDGPAIALYDASVLYRTPTERIASLKEFTIRRIQRRVQFRDVWALRGVSLAVEPGETFGLIGPNGAGKSTLLRLLARVIRPTKGRVVVRGRVAPLLEFGAGFHPELTGRENVYLNGALLGFSRTEMNTKLERIVEFAELEEVIDSPLRTYSSGMVVRLGFSIATDIEPEVLLVDEVLSVGDEAFQRKSQDRMRGFRSAGATIILVSHSMETVKAMCGRAAWLDRGRLHAIGPADDVVAQYHADSVKRGAVA